MNRVLSVLVAHAALFILSACGGGADSSRHVLPVDDGTPHAYTAVYLREHAEAIAQPEHLLVVPFDSGSPDAGVQTVEIYVSEPRALSLSLSKSQDILASVAIRDEAGAHVLRHAHGDEVARATLQRGVHRIEITPRPSGEKQSGLAGGRHTLYLKLADTPAQARSRSQPPAMPSLAAVSATPLGEVSVDHCIGCSFAGADLTGHDFSDQTLTWSAFDGATIRKTNFSGIVCHGCSFTDLLVTDALGPSDTTFRDADLSYSEIAAGKTAPGIAGVRFNGARFAGATLRGWFYLCDFGPSETTGIPTDFGGADLSDASLTMLPQTRLLQQANLTGAKAGLKTFSLAVLPAGPIKMFTGAKLDHMTPANLFPGNYFRGHDLSGTSFAAIDLSTTDLSVTNSVKLSSATDLSAAVLSNGRSGVNLAGQAVVFPKPFTVWSGSVADGDSGKDLRFVNLSEIDLSQADLTRARLDGANLVGTNLTYANLYAASLRGALLGVAPGSGAQRAASLNNAYMSLADMSDADLRSVDFTAARVYTLDGASGVSFARARIDSASFNAAYLIGADFSQASLNDADLSGAALINVRFGGAVLTNAKLAGAYLQGADFSMASSLIGANLNGAAASIGSGAWSFTEFDNVVHVYAYGATQLGAIATSNVATCPNGGQGPCSSVGSLTPLVMPPYPPPPAPCRPLKVYRYANCDPGWTPPAS